VIQMDYISKVRKDKRRYLGFIQPKNKYQQRKLSTVEDFLFYMKKIKKIKKLNEFRYFHISDYLKHLKEDKNLKEGTLKEKEKILKAFYRRNKIDWEWQE